VTAPVEPLLLQAVVADGSAEEAVLNMRSHATVRQIVVPLVVKAAVVGALTALTHQLAWLFLLPVWVVLSHVLTWRVGATLRGMRSTSLRPGSLIRVEWREHELVVHRPAGSVHFGYDDMAIVDTTAHLTGIWVRDRLGDARRKLLYLPTELVPPDAVTLFRQGGGDGHDPFGAAGLDRVFAIPPGWPRADYGIAPARKTAIAVLVALELVVLSMVALVGEWKVSVVGVGVIVAIALFMRTVPFRAARRRLPPGSLVGATFRDGRVVLALPDKRLDMPESRLRNVTPAGVDIVNFQFKGTNLVQVPVPRQLVSDDEIDRFRQVAGRRPMSPSLRLN
jgi:hypothetical protein